MDGALHPAWSNQTNLLNYDPEELRRLQFGDWTVRKHLSHCYNDILKWFARFVVVGCLVFPLGTLNDTTLIREGGGGKALFSSLIVDYVGKTWEISKFRCSCRFLKPVTNPCMAVKLKVITMYFFRHPTSTTATPRKRTWKISFVAILSSLSINHRWK